jgi:hypothetical protein
MKRKLVAAILGIAASVSLVGSAHAQGHVFFNTYNYTTDSRVNYGPGIAGHAAGSPVGASFTADLWYFLGTATLSASSSAQDLAMPAGWVDTGVTTPINGAPAGSINGPVVNINSYVSGPISFVIFAYDGTGLNSGTTSAQAHGAAFTAPSIATGQSGASEFGPGSQTFSVLPVPEPSIFALSGIGAAVLMLIRRKK